MNAEEPSEITSEWVFFYLLPLSQVTSVNQEWGQVYPVSPPNEVEMGGLAVRPSLLKRAGSYEELCGTDATLLPRRPCLDPRTATSTAREEAPHDLKVQKRESEGESSVCLCTYF